MSQICRKRDIRICKLSEIAQLLNGYAFKSKNYVSEGIRVIRIANVQDGRIVDDMPCFYPADTDEDIEKYRLFAGDLLVSLTGNVGRVGFLPENMLPAALNQRVCCLRVDETITDRKYLFYYLRQSQFMKDCVKASKGVAQLNLSTKWLMDYEVPLPEIEEQKRIVSRIEELFSELDNGVETLKKTNQQLAVYRQAVISAAFPEMTDENTVRLDEIAEITGGITKGRDLSKHKTVHLPYLRVANVQNGYLDLSEMKSIEVKVSEIDKYLLQPGDVLYTEGGDRDKLGRGTVWNDEIPNCVHQNHIFKARVDPKRANFQYVSYWSMSAFARNYFYNKGKQSVNLASINKTVLSALILPLPTLETQEAVLQQIESRLSICADIENTVNTALQQAEAMRQSILKQAFQGKL